MAPQTRYTLQRDMASTV